MTTVRACFLAALGVLLGAAPAGAQQGEAGDTDPIVVTGQAVKPPRAEVSRQAREITASGGALRRTPLARFEDRLCPGVMGLKTEAAQMMIDRVRWNAERLGLWLADDEACTANLIIAFVEDGKTQIAELERDNSHLFRSLTLPERRALLAEEGPVRVWTTALMRTRDGMPVPERESLVTPPTVTMWMAHSKIYLPIRNDITQVVVLFDRAGVRGKSLIQLADYATMRGFARTRPAGGDAPLETILALFDSDADAPGGMTDFDLAYLRSLYEGIPNLPGVTRIGGVGRELGQLREEKAEAQE